jgi:hypothetical protein
VPTSAEIPRSPRCIFLELSLHGKRLVAGFEGGSRFYGALYNLTMDPFEKYDMIFKWGRAYAGPLDLAGQIGRRK